MEQDQPSLRPAAPSIRIGVGAVIFRGDDVLLIKRGKPPFLGQWSIPGGGLEFGERIEDGVLRELQEETGITAVLCGMIGVFEALPVETGAQHVVMIDHWGEWRAGEPVAGDDAQEAAFTPLAEAMNRVAWDDTRRALEIAAGLSGRAIARGSSGVVTSP